MIELLLVAALAASQPAATPKPAVNTKCPVLGWPTDAKSATTVVRGQTYRVCCMGCPEELAKNPDKYLNKDGVPKNK